MGRRLCGVALLTRALVLTGCVSRGGRQALMVCDPAVADRCVPVPYERLVARTPSELGARTARRERSRAREPVPG